MNHRLFTIISGGITLREIRHLAARSRGLLDLVSVTQGLQDTPCTGDVEIQRRIDAVLPDRYQVILIGYGLCGNLTRGQRA